MRRSWFKASSGKISTRPYLKSKVKIKRALRSIPSTAQNKKKDTKQNIFGFLIIALRYKELTSCHFYTYNRKIDEELTWTCEKNKMTS
jgi:hypothetical protein